MPTLLARLSVAASLLTLVWFRGGTNQQVPEGASPVAEERAGQETDLWVVPDADPITPSDLAAGAGHLAAGRPAEALSLVSRPLGDPVLGPYARLYTGRALLALQDHERAIAAARQVIAEASSRYVEVSAQWLLAEALEIAGDWPAAVEVWQLLAGRATASPAAVRLRLARAAEQAGRPRDARDAYLHIHYEWPVSVEAAEAQAALARLPPIASSPATFERERARAERLFDARRFADARRAFEALQPRAGADTRATIELRLAQIDVESQRFSRGLDALTAFLARPRETRLHQEAEFFTLAALRGLKRPEYPARVSRFVRDHGDSPLAERALNDLATHYILANDDGRAAGVFTDMFARFPGGAFADRAAWRAGWWAYRQGNDAEAIRLFTAAATTLRRADYRPGWLYWTARAYARLGDTGEARRWYLRTMADYRNSYYGRAAAAALADLAGGSWTPADVAAERDPARAIVAGKLPANAALVRRLLEASLWDDALGELRQTQMDSGTSPVIEATIAYALNRKGELRPAITAMRRAYPQFMADGGEQLPGRVLRVIFPRAYADLIERYARERQIDRHLLTALVAQESTFQADVRSPADAWGLMQLLPSTGRRYATRIGLRSFSVARLTDPETNVRLGTAYLADLMTRFRDVAPALAAYNAGENRVERWLAERPGLPRDEFIDAIPFPETQNYVKRILGTAEDYRILYGAGEPARGTQ